MTAEALTAEQSVAKLSIALIRRRPFYGEVLARLKEAGPNNMIETAQASVRSIQYNPAFLESFDEAGRNFVLLHELYHIVLRHVTRMQFRNRYLWNVVADLSVNYYLANDRTWDDVKIPVKQPDNTLAVKDKCPEEMSTEQLYAELVDVLNAELLKQGMPKFEGQSGIPVTKTIKLVFHGCEIVLDPLKLLTQGDLDTTGYSQEDQENLDSAIKEAMKAYGNSAGESVSREFEAIMRRKIPWYRLVSRFLEAAIDGDPSFMTPDKNFLWQGKILPGPGPDDEHGTLTDVIIGIDTSGSIDDDTLKDCNGQLVRLCRDYEMSATVIYWSDHIDAVYPLTKEADLVKLKPASTFGTNWGAVSAEILKRFGNNHSVLINFTDGYFDYRNITRLRNTVFVISDDVNADTEANLSKYGKVGFYN